MTAITSAQSISRYLVRLGLDGATDQEGAGWPAGWLLSGETDAVAVAAGAVRVYPGGLQVDLLLLTPLDAGASYTVSPNGAQDTDGDLLTGQVMFVASGEALEAPAEQGVLAALTSGMGEALSRLGAAPTTRTVADFLVGHDTLIVESTLGLAPRGALWVAGRRLSYGSLDPSGCAVLEVVDSRPDGRAIPGGTWVHVDVSSVPAGAEGADGSESGDGAWLGQIWRAWRQTLITTASGVWLDRLSDLYGLRRLEVFPDDVWRQALRVAALGHRGTLGNTFAFLEALYTPLATALAVRIEPDKPHRLYSDEVGWEFGPAHMGRLVRVDWTGADGEARSQVFMTSGPGLLSGQSSAHVDLVPTASSYFAAANFTSGPGAVQEVTGATAVILPFVLAEPGPGVLGERGRPFGMPCHVEVLLDTEALSVPPSYLNDPAGSERGDVPPGALLLDLFNLAGAVPAPSPDGNQTTGPHPLYLPDGGQRRSMELLLKQLLVAGVGVRVRAYAFGG